MCIVGSMTHVSPSAVQNELTRADENNDGKVTKQEYNSYYNANYVPKDYYTMIATTSIPPFINNNFDNIAKASGGGDAINIENIKNIAETDGDASELSLKDIETTITNMPKDSPPNSITNTNLTPTGTEPPTVEEPPESVSPTDTKTLVLNDLMNTIKELFSMLIGFMQMLGSPKIDTPTK